MKARARPWLHWVSTGPARPCLPEVTDVRLFGVLRAGTDCKHILRVPVAAGVVSAVGRKHGGGSWGGASEGRQGVGGDAVSPEKQNAKRTFQRVGLQTSVSNELRDPREVLVKSQRRLLNVNGDI